MSYLLHLETSTKICSVALSENGQLIGVREIRDHGYSHGEKLTLLIDELMSENKLTFNQLSAVSVACGPGSYTGLRIGVSTAKGLCYSLAIPLLFVDSITSMNELAIQKYPTINRCPMIDARRMEVYSTIFSEKEVIKPLSADVLDENSYREFEPFVFFGDGATKMIELWKDRNVQYDKTILPSATGQLRLAYQRFLNQEFEDVAYCEPLYLKEYGVN